MVRQPHDLITPVTLNFWNFCISSEVLKPISAEREKKKKPKLSSRMLNIRTPFDSRLHLAYFFGARVSQIALLDGKTLTGGCDFSRLCQAKQ
jgi:hypothetical protein